MAGLEALALAVPSMTLADAAPDAGAAAVAVDDHDADDEEDEEAAPPPDAASPRPLDPPVVALAEPAAVELEGPWVAVVAGFGCGKGVGNVFTVDLITLRTPGAVATIMARSLSTREANVAGRAARTSGCMCAQGVTHSTGLVASARA